MTESAEWVKVKPLLLCKAVCPFAPCNLPTTSVKCLKLRIGDLLVIKAKCNDWLYGYSLLKSTTDSQLGIFPANYVKIISCVVNGNKKIPNDDSNETDLTSFGLCVDEETSVKNSILVTIATNLSLWMTYAIEVVVWKDYMSLEVSLLINRLVEIFYDVANWSPNVSREEEIRVRSQLWLLHKLSSILETDALVAIPSNLSVLSSTSLCMTDCINLPLTVVEKLYQDEVTSISQQKLCCGQEISETRSSRLSYIKKVLHIAIENFEFVGINDDLFLQWMLISDAAPYSNHESIWQIIKESKKGRPSWVGECIQFDDLMGDEESRDWYLVLYVFRLGGLLSTTTEPGSSSSNSSNLSLSNIRRPIAFTHFFVPDLLTNKQKSTAHFYILTEADYLRPTIDLLRLCPQTATSGTASSVNNTSSNQSTSSTSTSSSSHLRRLIQITATLTSSTNFLSFLIDDALSNVLTNYPTNYLAKPFHLRRDRPYNEQRNNLYIRLVSAEFDKANKSSARNIEAQVSIRDNKGNIMTEAMRDCGPVVKGVWSTSVTYHSNSPRWKDVIKVDLESLPPQNYHIRVDFYHCSTKEKRPDERKHFSSCYIQLEEFLQRLSGGHCQTFTLAAVKIPQRPCHYLHSSPFLIPPDQSDKSSFFPLTGNLSTVSSSSNLTAISSTSPAATTTSTTGGGATAAGTPISLPAAGSSQTSASNPTPISLIHNLKDHCKIELMLCSTFIPIDNRITEFLNNSDDQQLKDLIMEMNEESINRLLEFFEAVEALPSGDFLKPNVRNSITKCMMNWLSWLLINKDTSHTLSHEALITWSCLVSSFQKFYLLPELTFHVPDPKSEFVLCVLDGFSNILKKCLTNQVQEIKIEHVIQSTEFIFELLEKELIRESKLKDENSPMIQKLFGMLSLILQGFENGYSVNNDSELSEIPIITKVNYLFFLHLNFSRIVRILPQSTLCEFLEALLNTADFENTSMLLEEKLNLFGKLLHSGVHKTCPVLLIAWFKPVVELTLKLLVSSVDSFELCESGDTMLIRAIQLTLDLFNELMEPLSRQLDDRAPMFNLSITRSLFSTLFNFFIAQKERISFLLDNGQLSEKITSRKVQDQIQLLSKMFTLILSYLEHWSLVDIKDTASLEFSMVINKVQSLLQSLSPLIYNAPTSTISSKGGSQNLLSYIFPKRWLSLIIRMSSILRDVLKKVKTFLIKCNESQYMQTALRFFEACSRFIMQSHLQLQNYSLAKSQSILEEFGGDMRISVMEYLIETWRKKPVKELDRRFTSQITTIFFNISLVPISTIRQTTIPLLVSALRNWLSCTDQETNKETDSIESFDLVNQDLITKAELLLREGRGDVAYYEIINQIVASKQLPDNVTLILDNLATLISLHLEERKLKEGPNIISSTSMHNQFLKYSFMKFFQKRVPLFIQFQHYNNALSHLLSASEQSFEAALVLKLQYDQLQWDSNPANIDEYDNGQFNGYQEHNSFESEGNNSERLQKVDTLFFENYAGMVNSKLKESLAKTIIEQLTLAKEYEYAADLCRELHEHYLSIYDYKKLASLLVGWAGYYERIMREPRLQLNYYRVTFVGGPPLPKYMQPYSDFVLKGSAWCKMGNVMDLMKREFPHAAEIKLYQASVPPAPDPQDNKLIIYLAKIEPIQSEISFESTVSYKVREFYNDHKISLFQSEHPFHVGTVDKNNEIKTLHVARVLLFTEMTLPNEFQWNPIIEEERIVLDPLKVAIDQVQKKNQEVQEMMLQLKEGRLSMPASDGELSSGNCGVGVGIGVSSTTVIGSGVPSTSAGMVGSSVTTTTGGGGGGGITAGSEVRSNAVGSTVDIKPFTMKLNGILDAGVNGGMPRYIEAFFQPQASSGENTGINVERETSLMKFRQVLTEQRHVLKEALVLHRRLAPPEMLPLHERLEECYAKLSRTVIDLEITRKKSVSYFSLEDICNEGMGNDMIKFRLPGVSEINATTIAVVSSDGSGSSQATTSVGTNSAIISSVVSNTLSTVSYTNSSSYYSDSGTSGLWSQSQLGWVGLDSPPGFVDAVRDSTANSTPSNTPHMKRRRNISSIENSSTLTKMTSTLAVPLTPNVLYSNQPFSKMQSVDSSMSKTNSNESDHAKRQSVFQKYKALSTSTGNSNTQNISSTVNTNIITPTGKQSGSGIKLKQLSKIKKNIFGSKSKDSSKSGLNSQLSDANTPNPATGTNQFTKI